jgi:hypothetical protein
MTFTPLGALADQKSFGPLPVPTISGAPLALVRADWIKTGDGFAD